MMDIHVGSGKITLGYKCESTEQATAETALIIKALYDYIAHYVTKKEADMYLSFLGRLLAKDVDVFRGCRMKNNFEEGDTE